MDKCNHKWYINEGGSVLCEFCDEVGTILSEKEHSNLLVRDRLLLALEHGGVDNWEWYSDSINEYYPEYWEEK